MNIELIEKLWDKTELVDKHWLWRGGLMNDYGNIWYNGSKWNVHRLSLCIYLKLPYKGNWVACHIDNLCKYKICWNPLHLYQGTQQSNIYDRIKSGKHKWANRNCCSNGHPFTEENTLYRYDGGRRCKKCFLLYLKNNRKKQDENLTD